MLIYYDLDQDALLDANSAVLQSFLLRYNVDGEIRLRFKKGGARVDPAGLTEIMLLVKSAGKFDQVVPLVLEGAWTKTGVGDTAEWAAYPDTTGEVIATALEVDEDEDDDLPSVATQVDITLTIAGRRRISKLVAGLIENTNYRADATPPTPAPAPGTFALAEQSLMVRNDITTLTGGGVTALDGLVTVNGLIPLQKCCLLLVGGALSIWQLQLWNGTTPEDAPGGYVLPDDADDPDNLKIWVRLL